MPEGVESLAAKTYSLTLRIDGDYMDMFVDDDAEPIATLVGVNEHFWRSVNDFFNDRDVDMSRIIWPRRSDGSMDFPPPDGAAFRADHAAPAEAEIAEAAAEQPESASEAQATESGMHPLLAIAIIGGFVLLAAKRRKA